MARKRRTRRRAMKLHVATQRQVSAILQICGALLLFLALREQAGQLGQGLQHVLTLLFGSWGFLFPVALLVSGGLHFVIPQRRIDMKRSLGLSICLLAFLGMMHMRAPLEEIALRRDELAGALGFMVSFPFLLFTSRSVGYTVLGSAIIIGVIVAFEPDITALFRFVKSLLKKKKRKTSRKVTDEGDEDEEWEEDEEEEEWQEDDDEEDEDTELNIIRPIFAQQSVKEHTKKQLKKEKQKAKGMQMEDTRFEEWTFPSLDLLDSTQSELAVDDEELKKQARLIEEKLEEFGIDVVVRDARPGPTVTQFTLQPSEGVKLSKIANLKNDLALALSAQSLRIEAPIPGKALVGIEMPNIKRTIVHLKEILETGKFTKQDSSLTLPLGRDVSGESLVSNLADMPHLLIAGATGSGKSVCMNTFLTSLLYQNAPNELKLLLIDPKRVELMPYSNIPHLLHPVITNAEKALQALRWSVAEMSRRLHRFSEAGVRNISEYNDKQMEESNILPRVVIVIDELADLMMRQYRRDTETMVARIAQMARATGMHLIIATQRPSVDVITGLIKANIPTRISFRTVSAVDSRTILDQIGAEDLLGKGDMLFRDADTPKPIRIQGIFISTKEVERVINAVKIAGAGRITEQIGDEMDEEENNEVTAITERIDLDADDDGGEEMFFDAIRVVHETGKASASLLQRQLRVGYARAARLLDIMEEKSLIGPSRGAKAREIYAERVKQLVK